MQNSYPYTYEDSDELWLKQEEILENPLENEAELERYIERERMRFYREWCILKPFSVKAHPKTTSKDFIFPYHSN